MKKKEVLIRTYNQLAQYLNIPLGTMDKVTDVLEQGAEDAVTDKKIIAIVGKRKHAKIIHFAEAGGGLYLPAK